MQKKEDLVSLEAKHGEKMIEIKVRFWTNDISEEPNQIIPKHAWAAGMIRIGANKPHGIKPSKPKAFHSLMDISSVIEKVLIEHGVKLQRTPKMRKYMTGE